MDEHVFRLLQAGLLQNIINTMMFKSKVICCFLYNSIKHTILDAHIIMYTIFYVHIIKYTIFDAQVIKHTISDVSNVIFVTTAIHTTATSITQFLVLLYVEIIYW